MPFFAASEAPPRPESMKFPVFSLLAGNLAFSETSSQLTPPSTNESAANRSLHQRVRCEPDFLDQGVRPRRWTYSRLGAATKLAADVAGQSIRVSGMSRTHQCDLRRGLVPA